MPGGGNGSSERWLGGAVWRKMDARLGEMLILPESRVKSGFGDFGAGSWAMWALAVARRVVSEISGVNRNCVRVANYFADRWVAVFVKTRITCAMARRGAGVALLCFG